MDFNKDKVDMGADLGSWGKICTCGGVMVHTNTVYGYDFGRDWVVSRFKQYTCSMCQRRTRLADDSERVSMESMVDARPTTPFHRSRDADPEVKWLGNWEPKQVPVLQGSVIGYRAWTYDSRNGRLMGARDQWRPGINEAHHKGAAHLAPAAGCLCGFNALARFSNDHAWWSRTVCWSPYGVAGAIEAWSEDPELVLPGEAADAAVRQAPGHEVPARQLIVDPPGFRAPFAKIVLLAIDEEWPKTRQDEIRAVAAEFGADICKPEHLAAAAAEHGNLVSDEMLEWAYTEPLYVSDFAAYFHGLTLNTKEAETRLRALTDALRKGLLAFNAVSPAPTPRRSQVRPSKPPKLRLKTVGPPGYGKHREGDVVEDRKRDLYECTKGGKNGNVSWRKL